MKYLHLFCIAVVAIFLFSCNTTKNGDTLIGTWKVTDFESNLEELNTNKSENHVFSRTYVFNTDGTVLLNIDGYIPEKKIGNLINRDYIESQSVNGDYSIVSDSLIIRFKDENLDSNIIERYALTKLKSNTMVLESDYKDYYFNIILTKS